MTGRVSDGYNLGPKPYLTYKEENELFEFMIECSKMGYGNTRGDMIKLVDGCIAKKEDLKQKSDKLLNSCRVRFLQRWP